ncbi:tyrosine-protein phosphatase CDC14 homolog isoform X2 [Maniola jurtina]|uniref:tyrosine-protein phosphatase CDC14 homolog isoform X2 n=1 Tax=Maniola jurtina TaxID=191418 RepID=UPI001E68DB14|nr:tyrosine-protein phosphatase CDC14 homolog isoform X2 [Maniola jurtina]
MSRSSDILFMTEYIKNVLYFATVRPGKILKNTDDTHYFSIDDELIYENYYCDFGPLNLGCVYKYCKILNEKLKLYLNKQCIVHYTSIDPKKKANAAFLLGCYGVLYLSLQPKDALKPLLVYGQSYRPFQDATQGDSTYTITLMDCLQGFSKAHDLSFFNFQDFDYTEYDRLDKIQGGDLNWIVPAFIGPVDYCVSLYHPPEMYIDYFIENNVKIVIRLNKKLYDGNVFINAGITHYNLFFPDGSCPPRHILLKFLQISEECDGAIAVHCKAGLGRTGSLIGCYLIKHYRMTAHEAIAWMRICRPGSVIGQQQGWLEDLEPWLIKQGNLYRRRNNHDVDKLPTHEFGIYSIVEKTHKQRPIMFSKSQSPPPPIQRKGRSDISPPARPQASKVREAPSKMTDKPEFGRKEKMSAGQKFLIKGTESTEKAQFFGWKENLSTGQKILIKGKSRDSSAAVTLRRGSGSGEPRVLRPSSRTNSVNQHEKSNEPNDRNLSGYFHVPTFHTSQTPIAKTLDDARNILMRSTLYNDQRPTLFNDQRKKLYYNQRTTVAHDQRARKLDSAIIVKPQCTFRGGTNNAFNERPIPGNATKLLPSTFSSVSRSPPQPQQRRRLGRSPSPPAFKVVNEQSRATNTPPPVEISKNRDSNTNLMEELSRLKLTAPRHGSTGAASLGARRDAPPDRRAPSVRSDERPLATQGDMLNSIKFQRRFRESINAERFGKFNHIPSTTSKDKPLICNTNSRTACAGPKSHFSQEHRCNSPTQEKTSSDTRQFFRAPRPSSPKGRRSPHTFY